MKFSATTPQEEQPTEVVYALHSIKVKVNHYKITWVVRSICVRTFVQLTYLVY